MSAPDNWIKLYRWWQEQLKSHFFSSSSNTDERDHQKRSLLRRRSSLMSFRSSNNTVLFKKRASFGGVAQNEDMEIATSYGGFRCVRDDISNQNSRSTRITITTVTNNKRRRFRKSTTCDISSDEHLPNENNFDSSKSTPMSKTRQGGIRRFSLVKLELPIADSHASSTDKDDSKGSAPSSSPNLIQKLLFRQFSPKTRPCSSTIASDDNVAAAAASTDTLSNYANTTRQITTPTTPKHSWSSSSSSNNCKQGSDAREGLFLAPPNAMLSKNQSSDLTSYLSRRRNTTGSISINKIVDLKNAASGNTLKSSAASSFSSSNNKLSIENIFQTVEDSDLFLTRQLLQANENAVNSYNEYDWRPLDIAIMLNNIPMIQLLIEYGGEESSKFQTGESRYQSVCHQLEVLAQQNFDENMKKSSSNKLIPDDVQLRRSSPSNDTQQRHRRISKGQQEQLQMQQQQQQQFYQQRTLTLTQMKDNYEQAGVPDAPTNVRLMVTGSNSITVTYDEPHRSNGAMVIKYKIEWCSNENFIEDPSSDSIVHSDIVKNYFLREYVIRDLPVGQRCYVRVSGGNIRGFGPSTIANPPYCVPSSWREFSNISRPSICDLRFEEILNKVRPEKVINERGAIGSSLSTSYYANNSGIFEGNESPDMSANSMRTRRRSYGNLRRNLRQLFQLYPRLAKTMKRGLYLVSVMLNGERILVTNEDVLPMVEVDENYGHNLLGDFQWFMKLTFVWDDLKSLRPDLERCSSATTFYLRMKLVQAAIELQTLEEVNNLGRLHHSYIRDNDGNIAFVLINDLSSNNSNDSRTNICPPNLKWISMAKFFEIIKETDSLTNNSSLQHIADKLPDMIDFYHASMRRLDSGLYVAYLKMQNSVDCVRVMVNRYMPGSLPCTRIRPIANVSREEWEWLHKYSATNNKSTNSSNDNDETIAENVAEENGLSLFKTQFEEAAKDLCLMLNLPETHFSNSRIYDAQVVEIRDDLSLIILMSTADEVNVLSTPSFSGHRHSISGDYLTQFMYLPVYIFEVLQHLSNNYRFISQYSRVSICLDFELICAQQSQREAFSINELDESRCRLNHLLSCQQDLDDIWRSSRWLVDVINCAKDKSYAGISIKSWLTLQPSTNVPLKIITTDTSSSSNYASDSELNATKFTLTLPTTIPSASLSSASLNDSSLTRNYDSGFIDNEINNLDRHTVNRASTMSTAESNDPIELTFYIPILTSNTLIPFKLRTSRLTSANELLKIVTKQQNALLKSITALATSSLFSFIWVRSNGREQIIEDSLTAGEIEKLLIRHGGQIHVRSKGLSTSRSSQPLTRSSSPRSSPSTQITSNSNASNPNSNVPGSNLSLNL